MSMTEASERRGATGSASSHRIESEEPQRIVRFEGSTAGTRMSRAVCIKKTPEDIAIGNRKRRTKVGKDCAEENFFKLSPIKRSDTLKRNDQEGQEKRTVLSRSAIKNANHEKRRLRYSRREEKKEKVNRWTRDARSWNCRTVGLRIERKKRKQNNKGILFSKIESKEDEFSYEVEEKSPNSPLFGIPDNKNKIGRVDAKESDE